MFLPHESYCYYLGLVIDKHGTFPFPFSLVGRQYND